MERPGRHDERQPSRTARAAARTRPVAALLARRARREPARPVARRGHLAAPDQFHRKRTQRAGPRHAADARANAGRAAARAQRAAARGRVCTGVFGSAVGCAGDAGRDRRARTRRAPARSVSGDRDGSPLERADDQRRGAALLWLLHRHGRARRPAQPAAPDVRSAGDAAVPGRLGDGVAQPAATRAARSGRPRDRRRDAAAARRPARGPDAPRDWKTPPAPAAAPSLPVIPIGFVHEGVVLRYFSLVTTVGTPQSAAAQELRMECMFPADDATEARHRQLLDTHAPVR